MLEQDITDKRKERHKITQEDFTPPEIVSLLCNGSEELFTDFSKTVCDPCCGIGNIILFILRKRFENCKTKTDENTWFTKFVKGQHGGGGIIEDNEVNCSGSRRIVFRIYLYKK